MVLTKCYFCTHSVWAPATVAHRATPTPATTIGNRPLKKHGTLTLRIQSQPAPACKCKMTPGADRCLTDYLGPLHRPSRLPAADPRAGLQTDPHPPQRQAKRLSPKPCNPHLRSGLWDKARWHGIAP